MSLKARCTLSIKAKLIGRVDLAAKLFIEWTDLLIRTLILFTLQAGKVSMSCWVMMSTMTGLPLSAMAGCVPLLHAP